ncbi:MAG: penicillin-binding transpeptidase domain-containing protein, partial [Candidatus Paceibacterota bacterium]
IAAKTGTAEVGNEREKVHSWVTGYFPYDDPQYVFTVVMERGDRSNLVGATAVMRQVFDWMRVNTPEYLGLSGRNQEEN